MEQEKILWTGSPHWIGFFYYFIVAAVLFFFSAIFLILAFEDAHFFLIFLLFAIPGAAMAYIPFNYSKFQKYTITESKIIISFDFMVSRQKTIRISDIREIEHEQNLFESIFKVGSIKIWTAAYNNESEKPVLKSIPDFQKVSELIQSLR